MSDLLNRGIFTVELITNKRNRFPNYGVIYFLSPTQKSISALISDFSDLKKPKYKQVYIFFTHRLPENLLEMLVTDGIIRRTVLLKELNLSFYSKEDIEKAIKTFAIIQRNDYASGNLEVPVRILKIFKDRYNSDLSIEELTAIFIKYYFEV